MKKYLSCIPALFLLALISSGCVSTGEHERVLTEARETGEALSECRAGLEESTGRADKLMEANARLTETVDEIKARRESLGELVAECEFAVRERDDDYREQTEALRELQRELDARQQMLKPLLEQQKVQQDILRAVETLASDLRVVFSEQIEDGQASVSTSGTHALLTINNKLLYSGAGTKLTKKGEKLLRRAADSFRRIGISSLTLEGYTDDLLPGKELGRVYPSNWDLSASRAASVAYYLTSEEGFDPEMVVAAGHSDNSPLADNSTLEGRVLNRRLVLSATPAVEGEDSAGDAPAD